MNISDSERIVSVLESANYNLTPNIKDADLIVVNMCSVRQSAVDRVYGLANKIEKERLRKNGAKAILTGCVLGKDKRKLAGKFDFILDIKYLKRWPEIVNTSSPVLFSGKELLKENYLTIKPKPSNSFSAYIPITTGCNNFCAFCVVPYARGKEISRPAKEIICEARHFIEKGFKEIWLLGQNVNSYQSENGITFSKLLRIINDTPGDFWIRFTSSHPKDFSDELIKVMKECQKVTDYLNLPIQAGDDKILKKMNRPYTVLKYKRIVEKTRKAMPNLTISTDVIVGFPGETKKQFENTAKAFREIKFDMAYISEYSPRPQTVAAKMEDDVPKKEKARRKEVINEILKKTALEKNKKYINKEVEALIDTKKSSNEWVGKTRSYKTIFIKSKKNLLGQFVKAKIISASPWGLKGKIKPLKKSG